MSFQAKQHPDSQPLISTRPVSYRASENGTPASRNIDHVSGSEPGIHKLQRPPPPLGWILCGCLCAVFFAAVDSTIISTLLTPVGSYFQQSHRASYLGSSYLLMECAFTPLYGRMSDIMGRRQAMLIALVSFSAGTLLCGLSTSMTMLIVSRSIVGFGGAGLVTVNNIILNDLLSLRQRGLAQGVVNLVFGVGGSVGGVFGGYINDTIGWRWAFLVQLPFLVFSIVVISMKVNIPLPPSTESLSMSEKFLRVDWLGSLTLASAIGCFILSLTLQVVEDISWSHPLVRGMLVGGLISSLVFVLVEMKLSVAPVIPIRILGQKQTVIMSVTNLLFSSAVYGILYTLPQYFTAVRLTSPSESGLHLLPISIALPIGGLLSGLIIRQTGRYTGLSLVSGTILAASTLMVAMWNKNTPEYRLWLDVFPNGLATGSLYTTTVISIVTCVPKEDMAVATGIIYLFRILGQVLGVSVSGALTQAILTRKLQKNITGPGSYEIIQRIRHETQYILELPPALKAVAVQSYGTAVRAAFIFQTVSAVLMLLTSTLPLQEVPVERDIQEQENHS